MTAKDTTVDPYNMIGVIADDLTGANDSGVQFTKKGYPTTVYFEGHQVKADEHGAVVLNTDTRAQAPDDAYQACQKAAQALRQLGCQSYYKKIDSTLRGNIGVEIEAITKETQPDFVIVAPAFPSNGRTTLNGIHYLDGIKVTETNLAHDPKTPVTDASILNLLKRNTSDLRAEVIPLSVVRDPQTIWGALLEQKKQNGVNSLIFDAETDADLHTIVQSLNKEGNDYLWVGSAGLAEHFTEQKQDQLTGIPFQPGSQALTVSGSLSPVTAEQIEELLALPSTKGIKLNPLDVLNQEYNVKQAVIEDAVDFLNRKYDVALYLDYSRATYDQTIAKGKDLGYTNAQISQILSCYIGEISKEIGRAHV